MVSFTTSRFSSDQELRIPDNTTAYEVVKDEIKQRYMTTALCYLCILQPED